MREQPLAMETPARPKATAPTPIATTQSARRHHGRNVVRTPKGEATVRTAWRTCIKLTEANVWNRSRTYNNARCGSNSNRQQRKRCSFESQQLAIQATRCRTPARVVARDGYMRQNKASHYEYIFTFRKNTHPRTAQDRWLKIRQRQNVTGRPTRGAPNVTQTIISRTAVAEMVRNVTYSER